MDKAIARKIIAALRTQAELAKRDARSESKKACTAGDEGCADWHRGKAVGHMDACRSIEKHVLMVLEQAGMDISDLELCV